MQSSLIMNKTSMASVVNNKPSVINGSQRNVKAEAIGKAIPTPIKSTKAVPLVTKTVSTPKAPAPKQTIKEIFESNGKLPYGPAPEDPAVAMKWLKEHNNSTLGHFINGKWHYPKDREYYESKSPADGKFLARTTQGTQEDVDLAVSAANKAAASWSKTPPHIRARYMYSIARHIQKHARLFAVLESLDNGKTIRETRDVDVPLVARHFYHYAGWAELADTEMQNWKEVGVIGAIVPWNFPLMLLTWKLCPALAMGNCVVLKPATYTSLSALLLAEICKEAGLPDGVFNVVTGSGRFGSALASHPGIDKIAFTGSTGIGQLLRKLTAGTGKKISLELGGKSPIVLFDSADIDSAVEGVVDAIWFNQGQVCSAGSRLLIQETIYDKVISKIKRRMATLRLGHSMDKCSDMGPLVDQSQMDDVGAMVEQARKEGNDVHQSCATMPKEGFFFPPTLITNTDTVSTVVQEEIFGPVLAVQTFRTPKEAIALANNTKFGLGSSVWTQDIALANEVALSLKAGSCWINGHNMFDAAAGFGGYRESGFGRDGGKEGLYEYVKPKWEGKSRPALDFSNDDDITKFGTQFVASTPVNPSNNKGQVFSGTASVDSQVAPSIDRTLKHYIGGKQARPDADYSRPVVSPDGRVVGQVSEGSRKDVRNAVEAAHSASAGWGKRAAHNRAQIVYYMAENLELRRDEVAKRINDMTNKGMKASLEEVDMSIRRLFHWGAYADKYGGTVQETQLYGATIKVHEPVGVIGIACPDDFPLLGFVSLVGPAIVRGNTMVVVPSEKYPLSATDLYQVFDTSDLPGGVVNIITGNRDVISKTLVEHQDIEAMWYFGSAAGSRAVEHKSAHNVKRTWVNYGQPRNWMDAEQGQGEEFLIQSTECKNIWTAMGSIFAN